MLTRKDVADAPLPHARFGAQISCFAGLSVQEAVELYRQLSARYSLEAVEIDFNQHSDSASLWPWEESRDWSLLAQLVKEYEIAGAHLPFVDLNPISENPRIRQESVAQLELGLQRAEEVGLNYAVCHARGGRYGATYQEIWALWREFLVPLAEAARRRSLVLCLENGDFPFRLAEMARLVRAVDSPWLKITLDVGHAHFRQGLPRWQRYLLSRVDRRAGFLSSKGMPYEGYGSLEGFLRAERDLVYNIHLHDYDGTNDHIALGQGKIDLSFLGRLGYFTGPVILETLMRQHPTDFERNWAKMKELANRHHR